MLFNIWLCNASEIIFLTCETYQGSRSTVLSDVFPSTFTGCLFCPPVGSSVGCKVKYNQLLLLSLLLFSSPSLLLFVCCYCYVPLSVWSLSIYFTMIIARRKTTIEDVCKCNRVFCSILPQCQNNVILILIQYNKSQIKKFYQVPSVQCNKEV